MKQHVKLGQLITTLLRTAELETNVFDNNLRIIGDEKDFDYADVLLTENETQAWEKSELTSFEFVVLVFTNSQDTAKHLELGADCQLNVKISKDDVGSVTIDAFVNDTINIDGLEAIGRMYNSVRKWDYILYRKPVKLDGDIIGPKWLENMNKNLEMFSHDDSYIGLVRYLTAYVLPGRESELPGKIFCKDMLNAAGQLMLMRTIVDCMNTPMHGYHEPITFCPSSLPSILDGRPDCSFILGFGEPLDELKDRDDLVSGVMEDYESYAGKAPSELLWLNAKTLKVYCKTKGYSSWAEMSDVRLGYYIWRALCKINGYGGLGASIDFDELAESMCERFQTRLGFNDNIKLDVNGFVTDLGCDKHSGILDILEEAKVTYGQLNHAISNANASLLGHTTSAKQAIDLMTKFRAAADCYSKVKDAYLTVLKTR